MELEFRGKFIIGKKLESQKGSFYFMFHKNFKQSNATVLINSTTVDYKLYMFLWIFFFFECAEHFLNDAIPFNLIVLSENTSTM